MKLSTASTLVAASAAAAVIGLGAPAFASTGNVAHQAAAVCYCTNHGGSAGGYTSGGGMGRGGDYGEHYLDQRRDLGGLLDRLTDAILREL
jgi:hypothetical protein